MPDDICTDVNTSNTGNFCVGDLLTIHRQLHDSFVSNFTGITLRVDPTLKGNRFYCAVSQELFDEVKEKYGIKL